MAVRGMRQVGRTQAVAAPSVYLVDGKLMARQQVWCGDKAVESLKAAMHHEQQWQWAQVVEQGRYRRQSWCQGPENRGREAGNTHLR
ncbi:hypothetical protein L7F22_037733 [Adiantum nelumboides]|nr:hypothetical protein [Adiantum nelumboides]